MEIDDEKEQNNNNQEVQDNVSNHSQSENGSDNENEEDEVPNELLNEKLDTIMSKLEQLNIEKEIGEKEKKSDTRVIIDSIELKNFKSYADKKIIGPLHYRFNAVVGPNGSGKSNLMESLLFVFGKRAKKMRLHKLSELIHNSSTKTNCTSAKVTINFREIKEDDDNHYHYIEGGDFTLSREVFRNSSSKYTLNGKEITFDELSAKLNRKGIDLKHNRFLILQGEVEQISMMKQKATNPNETGLLEFLEDIIGTNRYVPLIEKLNKSIEELSEIKTSKSKRVKIAKNELNQLEDVKNASTEYYHKEKELLVVKHLDLVIKKEQTQQNAKQKKEQIAKLEQDKINCENNIKAKIEENSNILLEHRKIRKEQDEYKKKKEQLLKQSEKFDEEDKVKRDDIELYIKQIKKNDVLLEKLNKNYQTQNENISNAKEENPKMKAKIEEIKKAFTTLDEEMNQKEKEIFLKTQQIQKRKKECESKLQPSENQINTNKFQIEQNNSTIALISEKISKITKEINELENRKVQIEKVYKEKKSNHTQIEKNRLELESSKLEQEKLKTEKLKIVEAKYKELQNLLSKISDIKSSNHERSYKDKILQSLLKAQNEGKLTGIYGRLGDLGSIDSKYDCAITTACIYLDSIVVDNVANAQKAVDYLKKFQIGQATFLVLDKIKWVETNMRRNFNVPVQCNRLFDLVKYNNPKLQPAFYFALRDTLVAPDIKTAMKVAYGSTRHRVVTLAGELIEVYGTIGGGGKAKTGGMSTEEKNYSANPEKELSKLNEAYEKAVKEYDVIKIELNGAETAYNRTMTSIQNIYIAKNQIENEIAQIEKSLNEITAQLGSLEKEMSKYNKEKNKIDELTKENAKLSKTNEKLITETKDLRNELDEINAEINTIMGEDYNRKKEELKQMKKKIEEMEKQINTNENILKNANETLEKIKNDIEAKEKAKKDYNEKIEECKNFLTELETKALAVFGEMENCDKAINELEEKFNTKNKEVDTLKSLIIQMKDGLEAIKGEIKENNEELKKINKTSNIVEEEITKNEVNFKKLIDEFGFVEEFDEEIKKINSENPKPENDDENMEDVPEEKENNNLELPSPKKLKKPTPGATYSKYFTEKTLRVVFSPEELAELIAQSKEISYEYTMLQTKLNDMKPNMSAIVQYKQTLITLKERENDLNQTVDKLKKANEIFQNVKTRRYNEFMDGFNIISSKLKEMYQLITNGGDAELELVDTLDPFSEGISFSVRPYKKSWKIITNLSGGEKTLSSLSLIFALHHYKPSPLYVLDEIDSALDFRNVSIIANYIKDQTKDSQFMIISLRSHMFELANKLVGIYKTFDITKCITFDPSSYDVSGTKKIDEEKTTNEEEKNNN